MADADRGVLRALVQSHIETYGWHLYRVLPGPTPAWSYTIGLTETYGLPELVVAGRGALDEEDVRAAIDLAIELLKTDGDARSIDARGSMRTGPVDPSWRARLMLGDEDRYGGDYDALQLVVSEVETIDMPKLSVPYSPDESDPWRWLSDEWPYETGDAPLPKRSLALTDVDALRGAPLGEVARVDDERAGTQWECWAVTTTTPIPAERMAVAPLGLFLAVDPTVASLADLERGEWATRSTPSEVWEKWSG